MQPLSLHVALGEILSFVLEPIKGVVAQLRLVYWLLKHQGIDHEEGPHNLQGDWTMY